VTELPGFGGVIVVERGLICTMPVSPFGSAASGKSVPVMPVTLVPVLVGAAPPGEAESTMRIPPRSA